MPVSSWEHRVSLMVSALAAPSGDSGTLQHTPPPPHPLPRRARAAAGVDSTITMALRLISMTAHYEKKKLYFGVFWQEFRIVGPHTPVNILQGLLVADIHL